MMTLPKSAPLSILGPTDWVGEAADTLDGVTEMVETPTREVNCVKLWETMTEDTEETREVVPENEDTDDMDGSSELMVAVSKSNDAGAAAVLPIRPENEKGAAIKTRQKRCQFDIELIVSVVCDEESEI